MNIPIFLASDNNYASLVATTIASICDNTKSFCEFYILDGGISEENQTKIENLKELFKNFSIEFIKINPEDLASINYKNECDYVTLSTYNRFLAPRLKSDIDKAIYLDVDIIVKGDIAEFYNQDLENYIIGAVQDLGSPREYLESVKKTIGIKPESIYFNAGVLLINCKLWREKNVEKSLFDIEKEKSNVLCMADQDILNLYFENIYKKLPEKFNIMKAVDNFAIRHFAGKIKPWQADFLIENNRPIKMYDSELFWKYAKKTEYIEYFLSCKEKFLNSNILYKRFNKMVNK